MESISQALGTSGAGFTIEIEGEQPYTLHPITRREMSRLEAEARKHALAVLRELREYIEEEDYEEEKEKLFALVQTDFYNVGQPGFQNYVRSMTGATEMLRSMFLHSHPDITNDKVSELMMKDPEQFEVAQRMLHPKMAEKDGVTTPDSQKKRTTAKTAARKANKKKSNR